MYVIDVFHKIIKLFTGQKAWAGMGGPQIVPAYFKVDELDIILFDTPEFNNTTFGDTDVLVNIEKCLGGK